MMAQFNLLDFFCLSSDKLTALHGDVNADNNDRQAYPTTAAGKF